MSSEIDGIPDQVPEPVEQKKPIDWKNLLRKNATQLGMILVFFGIVVTMVASNTASAAILIPLMLPLSSSLGIDMKPLAVLIAIGVSLDFMMPVGTPPSAIAYSTGVVNVREMMKNGLLVNIGTGLILVLLYYFFYLPH